MDVTDKADIQEEMIDIIQKINYHFNEIRKYANKRDKLKSEFLKDIINPGKFYKFTHWNNKDKIYYGLISDIIWLRLSSEFQFNFSGIIKTSNGIEIVPLDELYVHENNIDKLTENNLSEISEKEFWEYYKSLINEMEDGLKRHIKNFKMD